MAQGNMKGSRDTRNILLESDCGVHEEGNSDPQLHTSENRSRNTSPNPASDMKKASDKEGVSEVPAQTPSPKHAPDMKRASEKRGVSKVPARTPSPKPAPDIKRAPGKKGISEKPTRTPSRGRGSTPNPLHGHPSGTPTRNGRGTTPSPIPLRSATHSHASPDVFVVRKTQGAHMHLRSARPPGCEGESNQATVNEVHNTAVRRRGVDDNPHVRRETENIRPRSCNSPDSERPRSTPSKCGTRDHGKDFAFMDGFETKEQPWKPGKKVVEQFNDQPRSEYQWKSSRRSIPGTDRLQVRTPEWRSGLDDPPPICRKGAGGRDGGSGEAQREYDPFGNPLNNPEWEWHPGKGRGNGPMPGEWLPPFRAFSTKAESEPPPFLRGKGTGRRHSDEWLPPFRVVDRPATWHRAKGAGSGPPPDQWLPPWGHETVADGERGDSAASARLGRKHYPTTCPAS